MTERQEYNAAHLFTFEEGAAQGRLIWEREFNKGGVWAHATSMVGDVDGDGVCEINTAVQGGVVILDLDSGAEKLRFEWEAGGQKQRNYGQCCAADVDGDGIDEIVVMDDLIALQVVVIKVEDGQARALWSKFWGWWYPFTGHLLHFVPGSVCDVDGDGNLELGVPHPGELRCYEAGTGQLKWTEQGAVERDIATADIDGDGVGEFIVAGGHISAIKGEGNRGKVLWRLTLSASARVKYYF